MSGERGGDGAFTALDLQGLPSVTVADNEADGSRGPAVSCPAACVHAFADYRLMQSLQQVFRGDAKARIATPGPTEAPASRPVIESQRAHPCRVIEFVGMPGAGKSTIERALTEALVARGHEALALGAGIFNRWARVGRHRSPLTPFVLLMRVVAGGLGTWELFSRTFGWRQLMLPSHYRHLGTALVLTAKRAWLTRTLHNRSGHYVLFSEFFVNSVAKFIATDELSLQDSAVWLSSFYGDTKVLFVYVDIPIAESLRRLEARTKVTSHVQKMEGPQAIAYLESFKRVSETCVGYAAWHGDAKVLWVSGADPVEVTIDRLLNEVGEGAPCPS